MRPSGAVATTDTAGRLAPWKILALYNTLLALRGNDCVVSDGEIIFLYGDKSEGRSQAEEGETNSVRVPKNDL